MKTMRGCLLTLAIYALTAWAVTVAVERRIDERMPSVIAGLIGGALLTAALSHLVGAVRKIREFDLIRRSLAGAEPEDGKRYAAIGPITPAGRRVLTPITRTPAVAYAYDIAAAAQRWRGAALAPASIRAGVHSIRLLGLPDLTVPKARVLGDVTKNVEQFLRQTSFKSLRSGEVGIDTDAVVKDADGALRHDLGEQVESPNLQNAVLTERLVQAGDLVCAIGTYSIAQNGLVPDPGALRPLIPLEIGEPTRLMLGRVRDAVRGLANAIVFFAIVAAALVGLYALIPLDQLDPVPLEVQAEEWVDETVRRRVVEAGIPLLVSAEPGESLREGEARGRIRAAGRDERLTRAAVYRATGQFRLFFYTESDLAATLTVTDEGEPIDLRLFEHRVPIEQDPPQIDLRRFGNAVGGRVTWSQHGVPMLRVTFRTEP